MFEHKAYAVVYNFIKKLTKIKTMEDIYYELWKFFKDEHDLILTQTQINDIINEVRRYNEKNNNNELL